MPLSGLVTKAGVNIETLAKVYGAKAGTSRLEDITSGGVGAKDVECLITSLL